MTLTVNHQLALLYDLLGEHTEYCCGEIAEYQQIKRLVQSLMAKNSITDEQLLELLPEIYDYGRQGEIAQNLTEHTTMNKVNIENWMSAITHVNLH
uniref:YtzH-like protein n=2 Tax=Virgibacillus oceani TaxID=1479511 RepID=A0A917HPE0_9BACI|nr:hypothetical protein GCM10011398_33240 [Virgibacillus oceani]